MTMKDIFIKTSNGSEATLEDHMINTDDAEWVEDYPTLVDYFESLIANGGLIPV